MQASWRLREQQRKQAAADEARRRAVEVSEISFPSLASTSATTSNWGAAPITPVASAAADRWSSGAASVSSYVTPAPSASTTHSSKHRGVGIHASISAAVRRTTQYQRDYNYGDEEDYAETPATDDGWTEVSKSKKQPATKSRIAATAPQHQGGYNDDFDNDFGSEEYEENM